MPRISFNHRSIKRPKLSKMSTLSEIPITKFEVLNPTINTKQPFYDRRKDLFYFPVKKSYVYYVECAINDENNGGRSYYILVSEQKFNSNCRRCHVDNYGRCQIKIRGEIKNYIVKETEFRGNIDADIVESNEYYDAYNII